MAPHQRMSHGDETPINDFLDFVHKKQEPGVLFGSPHKSATYIAEDDLIDYLSNPTRLESLLECVCRKRFPPQILFAVQRRLRIFAVLLQIGKGNLIEWCIKIQDLTDARLPLRAAPSSFSADTFKLFNEHQWRFCALKFGESDIDVRIPDDAILPIVDLGASGEGRTAKISRVKIHPCYCYCATAEGSDDGSDIHECLHEFIFKEFKSKDALAARSYRNEVQAFQTLAFNRDIGKYIVKFYGSFVQQETSTIVLEYADQGTLEQFYDRDNPKLEEDITNFWRRIFDLAKGLGQIHDIELPNGERQRTFHGVHQDLKPSNILVFSNGATSPYDYTFKLADLGHSHFAEYDTTAEEDFARVDVGARTYGPPDHYLERLINSKSIKVQRRGDVWSMACIFSEAASWVVDGPTAVHEFRLKRRQAVKSTAASADGDCFHNGTSVLPVVKEWHTHLSGMPRRGDRVTPKLWHDLLQDAFRPYEQRLHAAQFLGKVMELLNTQMQRAEIYTESIDNGRQDFIPAQPRRAHTHDAAVHSRNITHHGRGSTGTSSSAAPRIETVRDSVGTTTTYTPPLTPRTSAYSATTSPVTPVTQPGHLSPSYSGNHIADPDGSPSYYPKRYSSRSSRSTEVIDPIGLDEPPENLNSTLHLAQNDSHRISVAPRVSRYATSQSSVQPIPSQEQCPIHSLRNPSVPEISLQQVLDWKERRKSRSGQAKEETRLPFHDHVEEANGRDQIFLIDDAISMKPHWPQVTTLFRALSYLTKSVDDDGKIQLRFTVSPDLAKTKRSSDLAAKVDERYKYLSINSNPETACNRILQVWKTASRSTSWLARRDPEMSPVTLYIFTDGVWQEESDLTEFIADVVAFMDEHRMARKHIGIQFVQFGNDPGGSARLEHLDSNLGLSRDIVDTEPSNGNILKMLLGSVNPTFDKHQNLPEGAQCSCPSSWER